MLAERLTWVAVMKPQRLKTQNSKVTLKIPFMGVTELCQGTSILLNSVPISYKMSA